MQYFDSSKLNKFGGKTTTDSLFLSCYMSVNSSLLLYYIYLGISLETSVLIKFLDTYSGLESTETQKN